MLGTKSTRGQKSMVEQDLSTQGVMQSLEGVTTLVHLRSINSPGPIYSITGAVERKKGALMHCTMLFDGGDGNVGQPSFLLCRWLLLERG